MEALSPERPLRYWRLIEINQPGSQPLTTSALRADERIVNYLKGLNYLDDRLAPLLAPLDDADPRDLLASQQHVVDAIGARLNASPTDCKLPVIQLLGRDTPTKELVAAAVAARLGLRVFRLQVGALPSQPADLEVFARLWHRESLLLPAALYVESETGDVEGTRTQAIQVLLARLNAVVFLDTQDVWHGLGASNIALEVNKPTPAEQEATWAGALGNEAGDSPALLAGQFDLSVPSIREIARQAHVQVDGAGTRGIAGAADTARAGGAEPTTLHEQLWQGALAAARPRLDALAQRIEPKATWDDLVLPDPEMALLRQIAAQVAQAPHRCTTSWGFREKMNRGLGISALFAGESGTGKTMAAEVLANDLRAAPLSHRSVGGRQQVHRRDGEEPAPAVRRGRGRRRHPVLRRSRRAVRQAQRGEGQPRSLREHRDQLSAAAHGGVSRARDPGHQHEERARRRLHAPPALHRQLPVPRRPPSARRSGRRCFRRRRRPPALDFDRLARLNLTGGSIHNIALNAAFLAAQAGTPVTMPIVLTAARTEFRKLEKPDQRSGLPLAGRARGGGA